MSTMTAESSNKTPTKEMQGKDTDVREEIQEIRHAMVECPRFGGHLSAWSAVSGWAGRIVRHAKGIELQEAVRAGVPA
jgi:hypothetical protein